LRLSYRTPIEKETGDASLIWTKAQVTKENKAYLRSLPNHILWERDGMRTLLVHGSPRRINEYLYENRPEGSLVRMLEPINVDVLIFGHTHLPYHRHVSVVHMVNDGRRETQGRGHQSLLRDDRDRRRFSSRIQEGSLRR
jgi:predicted phosphodiesterase